VDSNIGVGHTPTAGLRLGSPLPTVDSNVGMGHTVEEHERLEHKSLDDNRARLSSTVLVTEVQTLKAEVEVLKRSFEEEKEARKTGDAITGESVLQLQTVLELEGKKRVTTIDKLEEHFRNVLSKVFDEISDMKQGMESKISQQAPRDIGSTSEFRTLRMELDREMKRRFDELDGWFKDTNRRFEDSHHRFEELSRSMDQLSRNTHEPGMSEVMRRLNDERHERQMEDNSMHQLLTTLAEQTNIALEEEVARLWEGLRTHNHDIMIDSADQPGKKSFQIQTVANNAVTGRVPQKIQLNQRAYPPASYPASQESPMSHRPLPEESPMMSHRALTPPNPPIQVSPPVRQRSLTPPGHTPTHAPRKLGYNPQNFTASETSMHHQEVHQFVNQPSQQNNAFSFGGSGQYGTYDQQQSRIRLPGLRQNAM